MRTTAFSLALALCLSAGCSSGGSATDAGLDGVEDGGADGAGADGSDGQDDGGEPGYDFSRIQVTWVPCALHEGAGTLDAECAEVALPRHWDAPEDGQAFLVAAKRRLGAGATAQLWFLHGGPGGSGVIGLPPLMESLQADAPWLDVYTLDPRGAGRSEPLHCPVQEDPGSPGGESITAAEMAACMQHLEATHGADLALFGPTAAAIDLAALVHATREPGKRVFAWGGSGGTFWAQRFLQLFPRGLDGVILEGIAPADESLIFQDEYVERMGREVLLRCRQDPVCSAHLPDPEGSLRALYTRLAGGHCAALQIGPETVRVFLWQLLYHWPHLGTVPAFIFRLERCSAADQQAIVHFYQALTRPGPPGAMNWLLFYHEVFSELWEHARFADDAARVAYLDGVHQDSLVTYDIGHGRNALFLRWPRYRDPLDDTWAVTGVPMLMLQGALDPSTPLDFARTMTDHFRGPHQTFVTFPHAPHNAVAGSPTSTEPGALTCGKRLWLDFLRDPGAELDTGCTAETLPIDFEGRTHGAYFFGTTDYWSETAARRAPAPLPPELGPAAALLSARLRQALPEFTHRVDAGEVLAP
jgi:pimeloyl-ACP methyl ester carboxylesterase